MRSSTLVALGLMFVGASVVAPLGGATSPGRNGRIAYMLKDGADHWQVWVASGRLTHPKKLTNGAADSGWAVWSPDGKTLVFDSNRTDPDPSDANVVNDVFSMRPDGSQVTRLTDSKGLSGEPALSPDGLSIAIEADRGDPAHAEGIYVMEADGGELRRVTAPAAGLRDGKPRFSPNGKRLVFTRYRGQGRAEKAALFTVRLDGTGVRRLTAYTLHVDDSDWSPDGRRIVFDAYPDPDAYGDIYVVDADGRHLRNLTRNPKGEAGSADPVWSPDGRTVLLLDNRIVRGKPRTGLATMWPDGTARRFVSQKNGEIHQPDWESAG
jgi:Tol biopolymer transport system component